MTARQLPSSDYFKLKAATRALVSQAGGQAAAANVTRVGQQALSRYGAADRLEDYAPLDVVADLEAELGAPLVTRALADLAGFDLVARSGADGVDLAHRLPRIAKETSDVVAALAQALADGAVTGPERAQIEAEAHQAIGELHQLLAALTTAGRG